jgi:hypothetical protein
MIVLLWISFFILNIWIIDKKTIYVFIGWKLFFSSMFIFIGKFYFVSLISERNDINEKNKFDNFYWYILYYLSDIIIIVNA